MRYTTQQVASMTQHVIRYFADDRPKNVEWMLAVFHLLEEIEGEFAARSRDHERDFKHIAERYPYVADFREGEVTADPMAVLDRILAEEETVTTGGDREIQEDVRLRMAFSLSEGTAPHTHVKAYWTRAVLRRHFNRSMLKRVKKWSSNSGTRKRMMVLAGVFQSPESSDFISAEVCNGLRGISETLNLYAKIS